MRELIYTVDELAPDLSGVCVNLFPRTSGRNIAAAHWGRKRVYYAYYIEILYRSRYTLIFEGNTYARLW